MSYNNVGVNSAASELQALTMDQDEVVVRLEATRAKLATCARIGAVVHRGGKAALGVARGW